MARAAVVSISLVTHRTFNTKVWIGETGTTKSEAVGGFKMKRNKTVKSKESLHAVGPIPRWHWRTYSVMVSSVLSSTEF